MNSSNHTRKFLWIPFVQGLYFFLTAVWPLLHIESFQLVTGFKTDIWLVDTVAFLLIPYAFICFSVAFKFLIVSKPIILTMILMGISLAFVELIYFLNGTIKWVYGTDAVLQLIFVIWWVFKLKKTESTH